RRRARSADRNRGIQDFSRETAVETSVGAAPEARRRWDRAMNEIGQDEDDREPVAALLRALTPAPVSADFLARVNARIDGTAGWLGLADFRAWTLGLVPAAAALVLLAILWPSSTQARASQTFTPSSYTDWQQDV